MGTFSLIVYNWLSFIREVASFLPQPCHWQTSSQVWFTLPPHLTCLSHLHMHSAIYLTEENKKDFSTAPLLTHFRVNTCFQIYHCDPTYIRNSKLHRSKSVWDHSLFWTLWIQRFPSLLSFQFYKHLQIMPPTAALEKVQYLSWFGYSLTLRAISLLNIAD